MSFDPYAVLKVSKRASPQEIEEAYRKLAEIYDPERYGWSGTGARDEATRRLNELGLARAVLLERHKNPLKRIPPITIRITRGVLFLIVLLAIGAIIALSLIMGNGN